MFPLHIQRLPFQPSLLLVILQKIRKARGSSLRREEIKSRGSKKEERSKRVFKQRDSLEVQAVRTTNTAKSRPKYISPLGLGSEQSTTKHCRITLRGIENLGNDPTKDGYNTLQQLGQTLVPTITFIATSTNTATTATVTSTLEIHAPIFNA